MQIESTRFGRVDIADDAVINFPDGLIGLPGTRYALSTCELVNCGPAWQPLQAALPTKSAAPRCAGSG